MPKQILRQEAMITGILDDNKVEVTEITYYNSALKPSTNKKYIRSERKSEQGNFYCIFKGKDLTIIR